MNTIFNNLKEGEFDDMLVRSKFASKLVFHINCVRMAGRALGVPESQLVAHDNSKWSEEEFLPYALQFEHGRHVIGNPTGFPYAWLHHVRHNPHHWQYWMFPDGFTMDGSDVENGVTRMPDNYALEMVADWLGSSKSYTNTWDMTEWLRMMAPRITLHSETAKYVTKTLEDIGYADVMEQVSFDTRAKGTLAYALYESAVNYMGYTIELDSRSNVYRVSGGGMLHICGPFDTPEESIAAARHVVDAWVVDAIRNDS